MSDETPTTNVRVLPKTEVSTSHQTLSLRGSDTPTTNHSSSKTMTNEEAIKFIQSEYDFDSKSVMLARMFAMEDIIEHDVEEWVRMPLSAGLAEFVEHTRHANDICILNMSEKSGQR